MYAAPVLAASEMHSEGHALTRLTTFAALQVKIQSCDTPENGARGVR